MIRRLLAVLIAAVPLVTGTAWAACEFESEVPITSLSAGFEAWKVVTDAMAECGNLTATLDQDYRTKQVAAMSANPSQFTIAGVTNSTLIPLMADGLVRPLDDLVAAYGQDLDPSQLIVVDGQIMAIAMMVNAQHLMYRTDVFTDLGLDVPTSYEEVLAAAESIQMAGAVESAAGGAPAYPSSNIVSLLHTAAGDNIADFLIGAESAEETLADIEAAYLVAAWEAGLVD